MTRRILLYAALLALLLGVSVRESAAAVTFRIETATIAAGATSGSFNFFIDVDDVDTMDSGILIKAFSIAAEQGAGGTLGGGGGASAVTFLAPEKPSIDPLIPTADPTINLLTATSFRITTFDAMGTAHSAAGGKRLITVPYTLGNAAVAGETISLVFTNPMALPFQSITDSANDTRNNLSMTGAVRLLTGSISVSAVPEPGSMLALSALFVAGGVRRYRKNRKTA